MIGYKIGLSVYKAPFIGPKSLDLAKESVKHNANNPIAMAELGNVLYFAPPFAGGSKPEAIKTYEKAIDLMETERSYIEKNWRYLNLLTIIYKAYTNENNLQQASAVKKKIVTIEPYFQWIKNFEKIDIYE